MSQLFAKRKCGSHSRRTVRPGCTFDSATSTPSLVELKARLDFVFAHAGNDERTFLRVKVFGIEMLGLLDSGATRTILGTRGLEVLDSLKIKLQDACIKDCKVANGPSCIVADSVSVPFQLRDKIVVLDIGCAFGHIFIDFRCRFLAPYWDYT